jgi:hypothetical protein
MRPGKSTHPQPTQGDAVKPIDPSQLQALSSSVLSDVMDSLGLVRRAMRPFVRPLDDSLVMAGRARTGLYMPAYSLREAENPYEVEIALVDDLRPNDVVVLACNGPTERIAPWGELLSTAARRARPPVASRTGWYATSSRPGPWVSRCSTVVSGHWRHWAGRARMVDGDVTVECAGVEIRPRYRVWRR